ncbi:MAG: sterol desaturase family protein, partial [Thermomicrobiales bacterium]
TLALLAGMWTWETIAPAYTARGRLRHGLRNLILALGNTLLLALLFGAALMAVSAWTQEHQTGLLNLAVLPGWLRLALALLLLDLFLYLWHRANHVIPWLWRLHRVHHADDAMDVTTATRFHPAELIASATLRLVLMPLLGLNILDLLIYDTIVIGATQFHHANISLGRLDVVLRTLIVTPGMHSVHHSIRREECDSNYGVVLSLWDRLAGTMNTSGPPRSFGVPGLHGERWRSLIGMLLLPFAPANSPSRSTSSPSRPVSRPPRSR